MSIISINGKQESNIPTLPVGTYPGVISAVWDIGKQKKEWQGDVSIVHQLVIRVEVNKTIQAEGEYNGKRYAPVSWVTIPKSYSDKSNLVKIAEAALGRTMTAQDFAAFDTDLLIGKNVVVSVQHTSGGNAKITSYSPAMEGMAVMTPELPPEAPEWIAKKKDEGIKGQAQQAPARPQQDFPPVDAYEDLPFD